MAKSLSYFVFFAVCSALFLACQSQSQSKISSYSKGVAQDTGPRSVDMENGTDLFYLATHRRFAHQFRVAQGNGLGRTVPVRSHGSPAYSKDFQRENKGQRLKVKDMELIAWFETEEDHVYVSMDLLRGRVAPIPTRQELIELHKQKRMRALDPFQKEALKRLRRGEELLLASDRSRMVGGLVATGDCIYCHKVPAGTLIGAMSYKLHPLEDR